MFRLTRLPSRIRQDYNLYTLSMPVQIVPHTPSRNIAMIMWETETMTLTVAFQKGGTYQYYQVPEDVVMGFERSLSATSYLKTYIVGQYVENRIG